MGLDTVFGHYRLETRLGRGGGGDVWRAYDTKLKRVVALKTMRPDLLANAEAAERFRREAQLAAGLDHRNIVRVHNADEIDDTLYIDMQLVDGDSVADLLALSGPLDPARVTAIVDAVAAALDRAHGIDGRSATRMIHRDVKPGNILVEHHVRGQGHVYLADFGVARPIEPGAGLTISGAVVGTPQYLAPELWTGVPPDHRIDVYALAVTTFEMLVGQRPFTEQNFYGLMNDHLHASVPRATALRPDLPRDVDGVIAGGMAKDRDDRHPTAGAFAEALRAAVTGHPAGTGGPATPAAQTVRHTPTLVESRQRPAAPPPDLVGVPTQPPDRPPPRTGPAPDPVPSRPALKYLGSRRHFLGLALVVLVLPPLYLLGLVSSGWQLPVSGLLLYALGVVVDVVVRAGRS